MLEVEPKDILRSLEGQAQQINIIPLSQKEEAGFRLSIARFLRRHSDTEKPANCTTPA